MVLAGRAHTVGGYGADQSAPNSAQLAFWHHHHHPLYIRHHHQSNYYHHHHYKADQPSPNLAQLALGAINNINVNAVIIDIIITKTKQSFLILVYCWGEVK